MHLSIRKHWLVITISLLIAVVFAFVGTDFYLQTRNTMKTELSLRLEDTAAAAALFINGDALDGIHTIADKKKPAFIDVVHRLKSMRSMHDVRFAYIMRQTKDPMTLDFIADADSLSTDAELDVNHNGVVDPDEAASNPGDAYDIHQLPVLQGPAFQAPASDDKVTYDQWGPLISGYAPIRRANGSVAAIIGIDMKGDQYASLSESAFTPLALLFVILTGFFIASSLIVLWEWHQVSLLSRVNQERSGLLKLTFHQLGEPLTIMKWSLETLREKTDTHRKLKKIVDEHVVCMDEGLGRLNSIIDTLQWAEKVDLGTIEYHPQKTSLRTFLENAIGEWQSSIAKRNQKVEIAMKGEVTFPFDYAMTSIVMRQLLQNAIEYSPLGSTIAIRVKTTPVHGVVSIEDHGFGIPKADMEHLFEKYLRASNAGTHKPDGNGLGLYIAKGIVESAGGRIWIESIEGRGTTVTFTLPKHP